MRWGGLRIGPGHGLVDRGRKVVMWTRGAIGG